jgi:F0F1-type ATP synthase delta subunit
MKSSPLNYAIALKSVLDATPAPEQVAVIRRFVRILSRRGDRVQGPKITQEFEKLVTEAAGGQLVVIESARPLPERALDLLRRHFGDKDRVSLKINPELIAGVRVTINGEKELDNTMAKKLKGMFA